MELGSSIRFPHCTQITEIEAIRSAGDRGEADSDDLVTVRAGKENDGSEIGGIPSGTQVEADVERGSL